MAPVSGAIFFALFAARRRLYQTLRQISPNAGRLQYWVCVLAYRIQKYIQRSYDINQIKGALGDGLA
jgi:hypothetical protein